MRAPLNFSEKRALGKAEPCSLTLAGIPSS
jgi:hypothetical protein